MSRHAFTYAALALALLGSPPAGAQPAGGAQVTAAREQERTALYREGVALANAERWEEAVKKFRQVVDIRPAPTALFSLAQAEERTGQLATAASTYDKARTAARAGRAAEVAGAAEKALVALEPRIPGLIITVPEGASRARATVDGANVALGERLKVDPGSHALVVRAPGKLPFESSVVVAEGETRDVAATLENEAAPPVIAPSPPAPAPRAPFPIGPVILGSAGVLAGVVGLVVRLSGQSSYDDASATCGVAGCPTQQVVDNANEARTQMVVGTVVMGVGVAAIAGAGVWWALRPRASASAPKAIGVGVAPTAGGAAASFSGSF